MTRSCLDCEGRGTRRHYIDRAGDFEVYHCKVCGGTGVESEGPTEDYASMYREALKVTDTDAYFKYKRLVGDETLAHRVATWMADFALRIVREHSEKIRDANKLVACPCVHITPCHPDCTCVNLTSSRGCERCCSYGSLEQQREKAYLLAAGVK